MRADLQHAAARIAANQRRPPTGPWTALRKLIIQERRDWSRSGAPRIGWKRGELVEFILVPSGEEWGDVGYYVAQAWSWLWWLYAAITPEQIVTRAVEKFAARASRQPGRDTGEGERKK